MDVRSAPLPAAARAYLAGLAFALAASPCSTPVLATLLAYVSSTGDPIQGGGLLLAYSTGGVRTQQGRLNSTLFSKDLVLIEVVYLAVLSRCRLCRPSAHRRLLHGSVETAPVPASILGMDHPSQWMSACGGRDIHASV